MPSDYGQPVWSFAVVRCLKADFCFAFRKDEFILECPALGTLKRLRISHDNSGVSPGWFLDKVIVDDLETSRVYEFPCGRWLAKDEDDGQISRELLCGGAGTEGILITVCLSF